ncbi:VPDSG-CTERM sorting domain-containing protein [Verrucomicrobiales bacterium]|nr:VPDSG-CTERM sorting domain-containing protein [Verrucomicrobiales bacterium]
MKNKWLALTAGALVLMSATVAQAAPITNINGSIGLSGLYTVDNPDLAAAKKITFGSTFAFGGVGDFSSIADATAVTMATSLTFDPLFTVTSNPLWSVGGFDFNLTSLAVTNEQSNSLSLSGAGTVTNTSFTDTPGTWVATFNTAGSSFTWSSSNSVPDGGATLSMFGLSLLGLGLARKKLMANS